MPPSSSVARRPADSKTSANPPPARGKRAPPTSPTTAAPRIRSSPEQHQDKQQQPQRTMGATKTKAPPSPNAVKISPPISADEAKVPARRSSTDYGFSDSTVTDCDYTDDACGDDRKKAAEAAPKSGGGINADGSDNTTKSASTPPRPKADAADPKFRQARPAHPTLTSSQSRVESFKSHGLSELSKQIRISHAKNEAMASEIERLERQ